MIRGVGANREVEEIDNLIMSREEALGLSGGLDARPSAGRLFDIQC
jgi:hypothetical protein